MKKLFSFMVAALISVTMFAGENDLLWDYTEVAPTGSPDNGLYYSSTINDAAGTNNGYKGIKLNSSGYAYFTKAAVKGTLKLTFGPRSGSNKTSLKVETWEGAAASANKPTNLTLIAETNELTESGTVQIELTEEQNNIFIERNLNVETALRKIQFTEYVPRTFVDFKLEFRDDPYKVLLPESGELPAGVTVNGSYHGTQHGYQNVTVKVVVDGPVKFTIGTCQYGNDCKVTNKAGETIATLPLKVACDNTGYNYDKYFTFVYTGEADELTFNNIAYCPYFFAEATDIMPCTVTFKDHSGNTLTTIETYEGATLAIPEDLEITAEEGSKFRGWFYANNKKAKNGDIISGNTTIQAHVTPIETVTVGSVQNHKLTDETYYLEDHETIDPINGSWHDSQHGWYFGANGGVTFDVAGNALVVVSMCTYSNTGDVVLMNGETEIDRASVEKQVTADGTEASFRYVGEPTKLTLTVTDAAYIHRIIVYNVLDFLEKDETTGYYMVPAGDAASFLLALVQANATGDAKIFLPNGTYDLGETVLTTISANNIAIIGESMEGTIILNAPDASTESINNTATLQIVKNVKNTYLQDLTIQNALDYYKNDNGRAVCLWDQGTQTICKNVRLLSYQDTYYSNLIGAVKYFEGGSIHGTVDYICGDGSVYFKNVELYCEKRNANGGGSDAVTASNADKTDKGYVFEGCVLRSECPTVSLGRAWNNQPQTIFLNTVVDYSAGEFSFTGGGITRWTESLMNPGAWPIFGEYNTVDTEGNVINPASNIVSFLDKTNNETKQIETIFTAEQAAAYSYDNFFGTAWDPAAQAAQATLAVTEEGGKVKWTSSASLFLVYVGEDIYAITSDTELDLATAGATADQVSVRAANQRGGFSAPVKVGGESVDGVENIAAQPKAQKRFVNGMLQIELNGEVFNALGQKIAK